MEDNLNDLEKRIAALEGQVQKQPKEFDVEKFVKTVEYNLPAFSSNLDIREGSTVNDALKTIGYAIQQTLKAL